MKRLLVTLTALLFIMILRANPIAMPSVALSELSFDSIGNWVIELQYFDAIDQVPIDSIWIKTTSGIAQVRNFNIIGSTGLIIVRKDSLSSSLIVNPKKDSIQIITKIGSYKSSSLPLVYGDFPNSKNFSPKAGQSIAGVIPYYNYSGLYSLDKSPTIGAVNDTTGMCGTISGHIYDKNGQLLSINGGWFDNLETDIYFYPKQDGSYSTRLYSKHNHIDKLYYYLKTEGDFVKIVPIDVSIKPDSVVSMDIHLIDAIKVGIKETKCSESILKIYPNPVIGFTLKYELSIPVKSSECFINLFNIQGQKINQFHITENIGVIDLPTNLENGIYSISLSVNSRIYGSSKVIINR